MQHDFYRPAGFHFFKGGLDAAGKLVAFRDHFVTFGRGGKLPDSAAMDANEFPAQLVPHLEYGQSVMELGVPTGPLRAPRSNALGFVFQSFIDELAYRAGKDPVEFRLALLGEPRVLVNSTGKPDPLRDFDTGRMRGVLRHVARDFRLVAAQALPKRTGKGVAFYFSHLGYFAEVVREGDRLRGRQGQSGLGRRRCRQPDHQSQRCREPGAGRGDRRAGRSVGPGDHDRSWPRSAVQFRQCQTAADEPGAAGRGPFSLTDHPPTGSASPRCRRSIPALCNAIFAATGKRIRSLPIDATDLKV